ncbi:hypothetical protein SAMN05421805_115152 [Saccharopolyspora antimicrobica]|uniref:Uncharacterized protein n=1 Tax=Saccharopolyspora antimicrobica TaxID=455193 RepID=A0A1I5HIR8_9PSEU|nr:hypothetical protein [Saccharopolyspora antimicrobica]RKT85271.1 hypothetical protein ATL45_3610 [Saccharopolyspora antimicrobica]SFO48155.1 hypothetical protein SAMN05421805_115152 [Saccharopolyspora antimicrobica]
MGIHREAAVFLAALGALAASGPAFAAPAGPAGPPLRVEVGQVQCLRLDSPIIPAHLRQTYPTVELRMRSTARDDQRVGYSVAVDGTERAAGEVAGSGTSVNAISIDNGRDSRLVVTSGGAVVVDRVLTGRC